MVKLIGYWCKRVDPKAGFHIDPKVARNLDPSLWKPYIENEQYPCPGDLIDPDFWTYYDRNKVVAYLQTGLKCTYYRGMSSCRLCGTLLGSYEITDGTWCWPDKLEHYILDHNVRLPEEFVKHAISSNPTGNSEGASKIIEVDDSHWVTWTKTLKLLKDKQ